MNIETIKQAYEYRCAFLDYKDRAEVYGYVYSIDKAKYFIDAKETYIKPLTD